MEKNYKVTKSFDGMIKIFEAYKEFTEGIIEIEKVFGPDALKVSMENFPEILEKLQAKNSDLAGEIAIFLLEVGNVVKTMNNFSSLTIPEKEALALKLAKLVEKMKKIKEKIKEEENVSK